MKFDDPDLVNRLETCVKRTGGKKSLAEASQISLPQLFRYIKGESSLTVDRLMAIARASNVHPLWLLTGEGTPDLPPIKAFVPRENGIALDSKSLSECIALSDKLNREYQFQLTSSQRSDFAVALYQGLYLESKLYNKPIKFESSKALEVFAYLNGVQGEIPRRMILNTIDVMDSISKDKIPEKEVRTFVNYVITAVRGYYNHPTVMQPYFDRIGYRLESDTATLVNEMLKDVRDSYQFKGSQIETLDLGCGNGRHLLHLSKMPEFILKGVDNGELSKKTCLAYEDSGRLPKGTFVEGDFLNLPFKDHSLDFIFMNASLFHIPYFPKSPHGLHAAFKEMLRVLRPKGYIYVHSRLGSGYEPFPFFQLHNEGSMRQVSSYFGLNMLWFKKFFWQDSVELIPKTSFNDWFSTLLRAP